MMPRELTGAQSLLQTFLLSCKRAITEFLSPTCAAIAASLVQVFETVC